MGRTTDETSEERVKLTPDVLDLAVARQIIDLDQARQLAALVHDQTGGQLPDQTGQRPAFSFTLVLYYLGGGIAIGAMGLFVNVGWKSFGGWGVVWIALAYGLLGLCLTRWFQARAHAVPAAVCATFVVTLAPLVVYGLQQALGWGAPGRHGASGGAWLYMELATLAAGAVMIQRFRYPLLLMPVAVALWCLAIDLVAILSRWPLDFEIRALISLYAGLLMICGGLWLDIRTRHGEDFAFWIHLVGALAFWYGLTTSDRYGEWTELAYFLINLGMIGFGALVLRKIFVVLGAIGASLYLGHLASTLFRDSWLFPASLTAIGLLIVCLGLLWQNNQQAVAVNARRILPQPLRQMLERRGRSAQC